MVKRPFLVLGVASFFAALLSAYVPLSWLPFAAIAAAVLFVALTVIRRCALTSVGRLAVLGVLLMTVGFGVKERVAVAPLLAMDGQEGYAVLRVEETVSDREAVAATVEAGAFPRGTSVRLWLDEAVSVRAGDMVAGTVRLSAAFTDPLSDRARSARAFGTYLYAWSATDEPFAVYDGQESLSWWQRALYGTRTWIHDGLHVHLPSSSAALCESMLIGEQGAMEVETETAFRRSGVYHLLVVSGLHLTLITGMLLVVLRWIRVPRRVRVCLTMAAVLIFTALCGFTASIVRAAVMMWLVLAAMLLRRRTDGLNSLGAAAFIMLLFDPYAVLDIGWQLSFAATLAMVGWLPVWERKVTDRVRTALPRVGRLLAPVLTAIGASLAATLLTQPLTTLYFGELSLVFLPTNLLAVPLGSAIVVLTMAALLFTGWAPPVASALFWLVDRMNVLMTAYVYDWASLPFSSVGDVPLYAVLWLFFLIGMLVLGYRLQAMRGVWRATALMLGVLCISVVVSGMLMRGVSTVTVGDSDVPWVLVKTDEGDGLIVSAAADEETTRRTLSEEGVRRLSWVVYLPAEEACGLTLSVPTAQLVLPADGEQYASFPQAECVRTLRDGQHLQIGRDASLARSGNTYRLRLGDTAWLLCTEQSDVNAIPTAWREAEVLLWEGTAHGGVNTLYADQIVLFDSYGACAYSKERLPHRFETVWMPKAQEPPTFLTRGNGDITLRIP